MEGAATHEAHLHSAGLHHPGNGPGHDGHEEEEDAHLGHAHGILRHGDQVVGGMRMVGCLIVGSDQTRQRQKAKLVYE